MLAVRDDEHDVGDDEVASLDVVGGCQGRARHGKALRSHADGLRAAISGC